VKKQMEIRLKGTNQSLNETALFASLEQKRNEETALRHEAIRARQRAIKRAKNQLVTAALLGETRLYLESE
jgi:hypothetical protein